MQRISFSGTVNNKEGKISERYWTFINAVTEDLWKKYPAAKMYVAAYQTFLASPANKKLIPTRVNFGLTFKRTCWRHDMDDPQCLANTYYNALYPVVVLYGII